MPTIRGIDLYHGDNVQLHDVQAAGMAFCILKASQGATGVDPTFAARWAALRNPTSGLTMARGAYHYFTADDPVTQATHFLHTVGPKVGDLRLTLDVETEFPNLVARTMKAVTAIKTATGHYPFLYCNLDFWTRFFTGSTIAADCPLWLARYNVPDPGVGCALWQYTEAGSLTGVSGKFDLDLFYGTAADLKAKHALT